jgi:hypothetical protein
MVPRLSVEASHLPLKLCIFTVTRVTLHMGSPRESERVRGRKQIRGCLLAAFSILIRSFHIKEIIVAQLVLS